MRNLFKTFLVGAVMATALAVAPSASAQALEVFDDDTDLHCSPCTSHLASNGPFETYVDIMGSPILISECDVELDMEVAEDGSATVDEDTITMTGENCTREACDGVDWTGTFTEDQAAPPMQRRVILEVTICVQSFFGSPGPCTIHIVPVVKALVPPTWASFAFFLHPCEPVAMQPPIRMSGQLDFENEEIEEEHL